jgi:hypothetical protein
MISALLAATFLAAPPDSALFLSPDPSGKSVTATLGTTPGRPAPTAITVRGRFDSGREAPVELKSVAGTTQGELGLIGATMAFADWQLPGQPVHYHAKAVLPEATVEDVTIGKSAVLEIVPIRGETMQFRLLSRGTALAHQTATVYRPDGTTAEHMTDANGLTPAENLPGRYRVLVVQADRQATLVVDFALPKPQAGGAR